MAGCRYRVGDALGYLTLVLTALTYSVWLGITEHWAHFVTTGVISLVFILGSILNRKERAKDEIKQLRAERQIALGVPPDEAR